MRRTVQDVMTREVVAVRGSTPFKELVRLLNEHRVTALPVLDDVGAVVVGVVSESDLALKEVRPLRGGHTPIFESTVAVETRVGWAADDTAAQDPPSEPAPLA
jgi:CBS-domain-containing membrane protein